MRHKEQQMSDDAILRLAQQIITRRTFNARTEVKQWVLGLFYNQENDVYWATSDFYVNRQDAVEQLERDGDVLIPLDASQASRVFHLLCEHAGIVGTTGPNEVKSR